MSGKVSVFVCVCRVCVSGVCVHVCQRATARHRINDNVSEHNHCNVKETTARGLE